MIKDLFTLHTEAVFPGFEIEVEKVEHLGRLYGDKKIEELVFLSKAEILRDWGGAEGASELLSRLPVLQD